MPSTVTILCQIKSKGLDGGFVNGLAKYMIEPKNYKIFRYGYYKKQVSLFLHDLQVNDYALICGKCVFDDNEDMHILLSAAFKIENSGHNEIQISPTGPYISFAGRIYSRPEEQENDCKFGIYLTEYNNFNFGNKEKMNFKIQVVYDASPNSRFRKLASILEIGKLLYVSGFLDLNDNELPFVEAKEIDLLNELMGDQNSTFKSPFSRTSKFKNNNKNVSIKKEKTLDNNLLENDKEKIDDIIEESELSDEKDSENSKRFKGKKKSELMDLSAQRLKRGRSNAYNKDNDEINNNEKEIIEVKEANEPPKKRAGRKKKIIN